MLDTASYRTPTQVARIAQLPVRAAWYRLVAGHVKCRQTRAESNIGSVNVDRRLT